MTYYIYHYEPMNNGKFMCIFEPHEFDNYNDAKMHASCLSYLSHCYPVIIPSDQISNIHILLDQDDIDYNNISSTLLDHIVLQDDL